LKQEIWGIPAWSLVAFLLVTKTEETITAAIYSVTSRLSNTDLYCDFTYTSYGDEHFYACDVYSYKHNVENINSVGGFNRQNKTNSDVEGFKLNKEMKILKNGIGKVFPKLKHIEIEKANLNEIKRSNFESMKNVKFVFIRQNNLKEIPEDVFWDLENLNELKLSENNLKILPQKFLVYSSELTSFDAQNNQIEHIDENFFVNNKNLKYIWMENNNLKSLTGKLLSSLVNLKLFNAENNQIELIGKNFFANNENLENIYLSENKLKTILATFSDLPEVFILSFRSNVCIDETVFAWKNSNEERKNILMEFDMKITEQC
jgi:hypothetical protein